MAVSLFQDQTVSAICFQTPSLYVLPVSQGSKFNIHIKWLRAFKLNFQTPKLIIWFYNPEAENIATVKITCNLQQM
jgi:hypothetical protein